MSTPKSIYIVNRKNTEFLYAKILPYMRTHYDTKFTIIGEEDKIPVIEKWCSIEDLIISLNKINEDYINLSVPQEEIIFEKARYYEEKYNITYLRDSILQDRHYSLTYIHTAVNNPGRRSQVEPYINIINKQNYFFEYVEKLFEDRSIDLVISRPDNLLGFAATTVAKAKNIPVTLNDVTKLDGYMYWCYGAYTADNQLKQYIKNLSSEDFKKIEDIKIETSSHSFKDRENLLRALSFRALISDLIYIFKDRLNWIIKDIKNRKLGKRVPMFKVIKSKIIAYKEHRFFQEIFESDMEVIKKYPYVYFPLPTEPEFNTHSLSKEFINTYAMVQQAAISLPAGFKLVIKEHTPNIGSRSNDFYTRLQKIPNLIIANYILSGPELIDHANSVLTVAGSSAVEAAERGKIAVIFATSVEWQFLPNIVKAHSLRDLTTVFKSVTKELTDEKKKEIINSAKLLKLAYKECGYYVPNTPLFHGTSQEIAPKELTKAVDKLIEVYNLQKIEYIEK